MPPEDLQVEVRDLPEINQAAMMADLAGLTQSLEQRLVDLETQIAAGRTHLGSAQEATSEMVGVLTALRTSKSQLEMETAKQLQLTQQRDLTWETYKTLSSKVAELNLTRAAASSEVRFGAPAIPSINAVRKISLVLGVIASGAVGLILAVFYAFLAHYLGRAPFLGQTTASSMISR